MINLLLALLGQADVYRRAARGSIFILFLNTLALTLIVGVISARGVFMDPWVAGVGFFWILMTAVAFIIIWLQVPATDAIIVGTQVPGARAIANPLLRSLAFFFLLEITIVIFFWIFPIWANGAGGFYGFVLLLSGLGLSAVLRRGNWDWKYFWQAYVIAFVLLLGFLVLLSVSQNKNAGSDWTNICSLFPQGIKWLIIGLVLISVSLIPRAPIRKLWGTIGGICVLVWLGSCLLGYNLPTTAAIKSPTVKAAPTTAQPTFVPIHTGVSLKHGESVVIACKKAIPVKYGWDQCGQPFHKVWPAGLAKATLINRLGDGMMDNIILTVPAGTTREDFEISAARPPQPSADDPSPALQVQA